MLMPVRTAAPAKEVVSLAEVKAHCAVEHDDDDAILQAYLTAAIGYLDGYAGVLGRALVTQTWRQDFYGFASCLRLPLRPVQSATVKYQDANDAEQTLAASVYALLADARGAYLSLTSGQSWPSTYDRADAVAVTFIAGYGAAPTDVPPQIRTAILLHVAQLYRNREAAGDASTILPLGYDALIHPFRTGLL